MQKVTNSPNNIGDETLIYCDIETSDLTGKVLLQIACSTPTKNFNIYCKPTGYLNKTCEQITGLYCIRNELFKNGRKLPTCTVEQALIEFKKFIESFDNKVILVFYNAFGFDVKILTKHFYKSNVALPHNLTKYADSFPSLKRLLKKEQIENFKLSTLCDLFEVPLLNAHDATSDSHSLRLLCEKIMKQKEISVNIFFDKYVKPVSYFENCRF